MSNPFAYLIGLLLAFSYPTGWEPLTFVRQGTWAGLPVPLVAAAALAALYGGLAWGLQRAALARGLEGRIGLARLLLRGTGLVFYAALIYGFHLPLWLLERGLGDNAFVYGVLLLSPLMAFYGLLTLASARVEAQLRGDGGTGAGYLGFAFRNFLGLSFLPIAFMLGLEFLFSRVPRLQEWTFVYPFVAWIVVLGATVGLLVLLPAFLRLAFSARPLPPGEIRSHLEDVCRRAGFRAGELLVVPTGGLKLATAFIVGLARPWRYVFFTDALLQGMTLGELECVLAHEIVHSKKRHILFYLFFTLGFSLTSAFTYEYMASTDAGPALMLGTTLGMAVLFWFVIFGFVSRRFESEADLVAARLAAPPEGAAPGPYGGARRMAGALAAVARLNRVPVNAWSWRHFNILTRIQILLAAQGNPRMGLAFERFCEGLRTAALGLLLLGAGCGVFVAVHQAGEAGKNRAEWEAFEQLQRGETLLGEGRPQEALVALKAGVEGGWDKPEAWFQIAEAERQLGRLEAAAEAERRAREGHPTHPRVRLQLQQP